MYNYLNLFNLVSNNHIHIHTHTLRLFQSLHEAQNKKHNHYFILF